MNYQEIRPNPAPGQVRVAVFDFDGTVSLLRSGWQQIMIEMMSEQLPRKSGETEAEISRIATNLVYHTNGQPTLFQMLALADVVRARGGKALDSGEYKRIFLDRLELKTRPRLASIKSGLVRPDDWHVPGVKLMLEAMRSRNIPCYLASGSDQDGVCEETAALGLDRYFVDILGATSDVDGSTKAALFRRLARELVLKSNELVTFGDGVEEIRLAKEVKGIAVGIARDGTTHNRIDPQQRARLAEAGADVIAGDFGESDRMIHYLFG